MKNSLNRNILKMLHPALQSRIIWIFLYRINQNYNLNFYIKKIKKNTDNIILDLNSKYYLYIGKNWIHILKKAR